ncbi:MAG: heme biosynthesis protein HemY, partial [Betaproteobacteria bacterium]
ATLLSAILDRRLAERLVPTYASIAALDARTRLRSIENWRQRHGDRAVFTIAAGRLCAAEGLWGKAEEFLRLAEAQSPNRETRALLARLYEQLGRQPEAFRYWRLAATDGIGDPLAEWPQAPLAAVGDASPPVPPDTPESA